MNLNTSLPSLSTGFIIEKRTYSAKEVASILGIHRASVYRKCKDGLIPHFNLGGKLIFEKTTFDNWLKGGSSVK